MLALAIPLLLLGAPEGYGSADGRDAVKTPLKRIDRSSGDKKAVKRSEAEKPKTTVVIGDLELEDGASLPPGASFGEALKGLLEGAQKTRALHRAGCADLACIQGLAAEAGCRQLVQVSIGANGRLTLLLSELPGRGLLRKRTTRPVEAADQFKAELTEAMTSLLAIGGPDEGALGPDPVAETVVGESAEAMAARHGMLKHSTWGVYGGAGLAGIGLTVGLMATINASQWRNTSFRHGDGSYREEVRQIAATRALVADLLFFTGLAGAGGSYYMQRRAAAGPAGKMTIGWGRDAADQPAEEPAEEPPTEDVQEATP